MSNACANSFYPCSTLGVGVQLPTEEELKAVRLHNVLQGYTFASYLMSLFIYQNPQIKAQILCQKSQNKNIY